MNSRERAIQAIEHEEPDRVPLEGVAWASWSEPFLQKVLLPHFGIASQAPTVGGYGPAVPDAIVEKLGIDFRGVSVEPSTEFRSRAVFDPLFQRNWGVRVGLEALEDEWEIVRQLNATKTQSVITQHPLRGKESLDDYVFPDPEAPGRFDLAERLTMKWRDTYAVSGTWGQGFFSQAWFLRGFEDFILDMTIRPRFAEQLLDKLLDYFGSVGKRLVEVGVDVIAIGDDVAMQTGMILSPQLWRRFVKPRMKKLIDDLKDAYILYHSDGNCEAIIPDLIEIGVDILNPIQPECMNPAKIKRVYGDKMVLSGAIGIQDLLPYGTVEDVRKEVIARIRECGPGGGFILSPANQVLLDVKIENFLTIYETAKEFGNYPIR